jgi:hypothetical protein
MDIPNPAVIWNDHRTDADRPCSHSGEAVSPAAMEEDDPACPRRCIGSAWKYNPAIPAGTPHPLRPGMLVAVCGHGIAPSEWRAGFRLCERCHDEHA